MTVGLSLADLQVHAGSNTWKVNLDNLVKSYQSDFGVTKSVLHFSLSESESTAVHQSRLGKKGISNLYICGGPSSGNHSLSPVETALKTTSLNFNYKVDASNLSTFNHGHIGINILAESGDSKVKQYFARKCNINSTLLICNFHVINMAGQGMMNSAATHRFVRYMTIHVLPHQIMKTNDRFSVFRLITI
ncbi:hypothetical protein ACTXT7_003018 [Hymenolepis weldensis]